MTVFTGVRNNNGVAVESLRKYVPSLFATHAHESRSDRYEYIPTWATLERMIEQGFVITSAQQARVRDSSKREHTKHLVRLRHSSDIGKQAVVGDSVFELLLKNSHDGSSLYELMGGFYRFVCANGMVVGEHMLTPLKVKHTGDVASNVIDASYEVINEVPRLQHAVDVWKHLPLDREEQYLLANEALKLRFDVETASEAPINAAQILQPRRYEDNKNDLWTTYNRIQENTIKGGQSGRASNGRRRAIRSVNGIDQDLKLNKALWSLTQEFAKLKGVS